LAAAAALFVATSALLLCGRGGCRVGANLGHPPLATGPFLAGAPPPARGAPTFAVFASLYWRENDPDFRVPCLLSLTSLADQKYPHWVLILVGDGLPARHLAAVFAALDAAGLPRSKVLFSNMDAALRERELYQAKDVAWFAGINAQNIALRIAYGMRAVTHVARLDDDDVWGALHLQTLAHAFMQHPHAGFAHTQAVGYANAGASASEPFPRAPAGAQGEVTFAPPQPCGLIHATTSWSVATPLLYRHAWEQRNASRSMETCCGEACVRGVVLPSDADVWERVNGMVARGEMASMLIAVADVHYSSKERKACIKSMVAGQADKRVCAPEFVALLERNAARCGVRSRRE
jgi:hypothetical protein